MFVPDSQPFLLQIAEHKVVANLRHIRTNLSTIKCLELIAMERQLTGNDSDAANDSNVKFAWRAKKRQDEAAETARWVDFMVEYPVALRGGADHGSTVHHSARRKAAEGRQTRSEGGSSFCRRCRTAATWTNAQIQGVESGALIRQGLDNRGWSGPCLQTALTCRPSVHEALLGFRAPLACVAASSTSLQFARSSALAAGVR